MWAIVAALFLWQAPDFTAQGMKALDAAQYEAAVQAFSKAVEQDPKDYTSHFNLALAYGFLHRDQEGVAEYRKALELKPGLYEAQLNVSILLIRQKNPAEALPLLAAAADQRPKEFRPRYYLAEAQLQTGATDQAEANYRQALELNPKSASAELGFAHALAKQGKLAEAAPHFRQAAQLDAGFRDGLLELADLYEKNHQRAEAIAIYKDFTDNPAVEEHMGELLLESKQYAEAVPHLQAAVEKSPTEANRAALAVAYLNTAQLDKALPLLEKVVAAAPADYSVRMMFARALRDSKQYAPAAREFSEALKLQPKEAQTWSDLAGMLYMTGDYPQSLAALDRARDLGEDTAGNWFFRAIMLDKLKQLKPALEAYQRFLSMSQGKSPDQEFQARQRSRIIKRELEKR